jgi:hypothetical protein
MTATIHPFLLLAALGVMAALVISAMVVRVKSLAERAFLILFAFGCVAPAGLFLVVAHPELVDSRFATYKAFYRDIRGGMNRADIDALLARRYPSAGSRKRPNIMEDTPERLGFFMNPETSREPNCEGIFLTLHDGRVTEKSYSPD